MEGEGRVEKGMVLQRLLSCFWVIHAHVDVDFVLSKLAETQHPQIRWSLRTLLGQLQVGGRSLHFSPLKFVDDVDVKLEIKHFILMFESLVTSNGY